MFDIQGQSVLGKLTRIWFLFFESLRQSVTASETSSITFDVDGSGSVPSVSGLARAVYIPFPCTLTGWSVLANAPFNTAGSLNVNVAVVPLASYIAGYAGANVISGTNPPVLNAQQFNTSTDLSAWTTTTIAAGSVVVFTPFSIVTITAFTLQLVISKTVVTASTTAG